MVRIARPIAAAVAVVIAVVALGACAPPASIDVGDRVVVETAPLRVRIDDEHGDRVLTLQAVHEAADSYDEVTQLLPGWDGYVEAVDSWRLGVPASVVEQDDAHVVLGLDGDVHGTIGVAVDGARVRLSLAIDPPVAQSAQKTS